MRRFFKTCVRNLFRSRSQSCSSIPKTPFLKVKIMYRALAISSLLFSAHALAQRGDETPVSNPSLSGSPFELVASAYQGGLINAGIPGYGSFCDEFRWNRINAKIIFEAGIATKMLQESQRSEGFLNSIEFMTRSYCDQ